MGRLVEGQPTCDGPEGQNTSGGFEATGPGQSDSLSGIKGAGPEAQIADNDVEGQINDERPFPEQRPYPNTQASIVPRSNDVNPSTPPGSTRRVAGSKPRGSIGVGA